MIRIFSIIDPTPLPKAKGDTLAMLLGDFFIILGAIAVFMVVLGGTRYIFARGNPEKVSQARNMIIYSLVGLVIASLAAAFVNLVLEQAG
ncbi:MAG: hypothetical protein WD877_00665 [Candidatus Saccharimonadales bacterium]